MRPAAIRQALRPASWVLPGAAVDYHFARNRYHGTTVSYKSSATAGSLGISVQGADDIVGAPNGSGIIQLFKQYTLRITPGKGLWAEGNYTNAALYCRDFSNAAWVKDGVTVTKNQIGANGVVNAAYLLTATKDNATILQAISRTSAAGVTSAYVRRSSGSDPVYITQDASAFTDTAPDINSSGYSQVKTGVQTLGTLSAGFKFAKAGDAIAVDFFQAENAPYPTSPLITTSAARSRSLEEPVINTLAGASRYNDGFRLIKELFFDTPVSVYMEFSGNSTGSILLCQGSVTSVNLTMNGGTGGHASMGNTTGTTAVSTNTGIYGLGNVNKVVGRVRGKDCSVCLNGGDIAYGTSKIATGSYDHIGLGNNGASTMCLDGYIPRLAIWRGYISDGLTQYLGR